MNEGSKVKEVWRLTVPLFPLHTDFKKTQSSNQRNALSACKGEPGTTQTCVGERNGWGDSGGDGDRGGGAPVGSLADRQPVNNL